MSDLWHDLNEALAGVRVTLQVVRDGRASAAEASRLLGLADETTRRLEQLLERLYEAAQKLGVDDRLQAAVAARGAAPPADDPGGAAGSGSAPA
jgi:hypothetical protein